VLGVSTFKIPLSPKALVFFVLVLKTCERVNFDFRLVVFFLEDDLVFLADLTDFLAEELLDFEALLVFFFDFVVAFENVNFKIFYFWTFRGSC